MIIIGSGYHPRASNESRLSIPRLASGTNALTPRRRLVSPLAVAKLEKGVGGVNQ
jgi:hypothetical protein